jgi:hypothetical protein
MRSVLPIRGAAVDIRAVAVDVTHPGCVATCEATGYRQQGGGGSNKRWLSGRVALSSHFGLQKAPWSPETRSIWARSAKTNVCLKRPKLARQQYNRKRCDVVKNFLAPFATPCRCRTSVCLGASSRLVSCPGSGHGRVAAALKWPPRSDRVCCLSSLCLPSCRRGIIRRRCV